MNEFNLVALAAPIPPKSVKTLQKKYTDKKTGETKQYSISYITTRTVMNRLDAALGQGNWYDRYETRQDGSVVCTLFVRVNGEWIGKQDIGTESDIEEDKGAFADALKRAAVKWGIGRETYGDGTVYEYMLKQKGGKPEAPTTTLAPAPVEPPAAVEPDATPGQPVQKAELDAFLGRNVAWLTPPVLRTLVAEAEKYWRDHDNATSDRAHTINRLAQEWGVGLVTGDQDALFAETQAKKPAEWTKEDAWAAVTGYTPKTKPAKNAGKRAAAASGPAAGQ